MNYETRPPSDLQKPPKREKKKRTYIKRISKKQSQYERWLKKVALPAVVNRDGYSCKCCKRSNISLDLDHIAGKGAHPDKKQDIDNLRLLCRFPCHRNFTDHIKCLH